MSLPKRLICKSINAAYKKANLDNPITYLVKVALENKWYVDDIKHECRYTVEQYVSLSKAKSSDIKFLQERYYKLVWNKIKETKALNKLKKAKKS
jgi:hypothetical protein